MKYENGIFSERMRLKGDLNTKDYEAHGVISPNGDYFLYDGDNSTFVSFKKNDGSWRRGSSLNKFYYIPSFSPDGKYIFFTKDRDIYWVSSEIIEILRSKELKDMH
jgi:Tol biopolymer transport system component